VIFIAPERVADFARDALDRLDAFRKDACDEATLDAAGDAWYWPCAMTLMRRRYAIISDQLHLLAFLSTCRHRAAEGHAPFTGLTCAMIRTGNTPYSSTTSSPAG
jgi:hypothetical protein